MLNPAAVVSAVRVNLYLQYIQAFREMNQAMAENGEASPHVYATIPPRIAGDCSSLNAEHETCPRGHGSARFTPAQMQKCSSVILYDQRMKDVSA